MFCELVFFISTISEKMISVKTKKPKVPKGIKYANLQFTDLLGNLRTLTVLNRHLQEIGEKNIAVDGSSIEGFSTIEESDLILIINFLK